MKRAILRAAIAAFITLLSGAIRLAERLGPKQRPLPAAGAHVVLTGTFYTDNWLETHLRPMARSRSIRRITMVAASPVPEIPGVEAVYPARWLVRLCGRTSARLATFVRVAVRSRADVVGGFHLLVNGLIALLVARAIGARSLYICGGGAREVDGGGYATENQIFRRLQGPSPYVERKLLAAAGRFDYIVTMGQSVRRFFERAGASGQVVVVPGGFDADLFAPAEAAPDYDLVLVGRLSRVKRVDVLIEAIARLGGAVRAAIVGDGPLRGELMEFAEAHGVADRVDFVGWQSDVHAWLKRSRIFVLTSESEGLSQAMVQAMLCALPVVVSDVGDLGDLVQDGINGYLVTPSSVDAFAEKLSLLCEDAALRRTLGARARRDAMRLATSNVAAQWDGILAPCT